MNTPLLQTRIEAEMEEYANLIFIGNEYALELDEDEYKRQPKKLGKRRGA